jgi:hypothetical protein
MSTASSQLWTPGVTPGAATSGMYRLHISDLGIIVITNDAGVEIASDSFSFPTEIDLSENRAISLSSGYAIYADNSLDFSSVGISTDTVTGGENVTIQIKGKIIVSGASWTPDGIVYLSTTGTFTQIRPTTGIIQRLGTAYDEETLIIEISSIIIDGGNYT